MSSNVWLDSNRGVINSITTACLEYHMRGSYGGNIPLDHIVRLFNSALVEIERLQKHDDGLKKQNENVNKLLDDLNLQLKKHDIPQSIPEKKDDILKDGK